MKRISSNMNNADVQYNLRLQESRLNKATNQMGSQQRIQSLRDDPIAAGHLVRYQSYQGRVEQFEKNAKTLTDQYSVSEGYINQAVQIMQRVRELAVTGANGTYTKEDMENISLEVNELLKELVNNANAVGPDGSTLFAGSKTTQRAFEVEMGPVKGSGSPLITNVRYNGSIAKNNVEVDEQAYMNLNRNGNSIFWAESQRLFAERDATGYQVTEDSIITVDGIDISLCAGFYYIRADTPSYIYFAVLFHLYGTLTQGILAAGNGSNAIILQGNFQPRRPLYRMENGINGAVPAGRLLNRAAFPGKADSGCGNQRIAAGYMVVLQLHRFRYLY